MQGQHQEKKDLLEELQAEVTRLLLAEDVREDEKLSRIKRAQEIIGTEEDIVWVLFKK